MTVKHRVLWTLILGVIAGIFLNSINQSEFRYQLAWNTSKSVDGLLFLIDRQQPVARGDLFAFYPPIENTTFVNNKFIKFAAGVAQDVVTVDSHQDFFINGKLIGQAKAFSQSGQPLKPSVGGVIPTGAIFAWTPHTDSYDSRYHTIGLVYEASIIGRATRLL